MNLLDSRVVLRVRTMPDILDLAFRVCFAPGNGRVFGRLSAAFLLPCFAACVALRYAAGWEWLDVWLVAAILGALTQGAFTIAAGRLMFQETLPTREVIGRYMRRLPAYATALLLARVLVWGSVLMMFSRPLIPLAITILLLYFFLWPRSLFVHEICLLEGAGPIQVFSRGRRFVLRHYGAALGMLCAGLGAQISFVVIFELMFRMGIVDFVLQLGEPLGNLFKSGGSVFALAGFFAAVPYVSVARFLTYIDLRTRKEGWDIQLKFTAIQATDEQHGKVAAA
jgi:hypothetical protein